MPRPQSITGKTIRIKTGCGWLYVTINNSEEYKEVFCRLGKSGGCPASWLDAVGRLLTFAWNSGIELSQIVRAFTGIRCPTPMFHDGQQVLSCADALAKALQEDATTMA